MAKPHSDVKTLRKIWFVCCVSEQNSIRAFMFCCCFKKNFMAKLKQAGVCFCPSPNNVLIIIIINSLNN